MQHDHEEILCPCRIATKANGVSALPGRSVQVRLPCPFISAALAAVLQLRGSRPAILQLRQRLRPLRDPLHDHQPKSLLQSGEYRFRSDLAGAVIAIAKNQMVFTVEDMPAENAHVPVLELFGQLVSAPDAEKPVGGGGGN